MVVAFCSILGRAGQLQCLILCIFGTIGFELNRQAIQERVGADAFGTIYIFVYGGFMGLAVGFFCYIRERKEENEIDEFSLKKYTGDEESVLYSILGALFIFLLFPFLALDIDAYIFQNTFAPYTSPLIIIMAMGAGLTGALILTILINGYIIVRDLTHGMVAGAIAVGAGSLYIFNPSFPIITGFIGGSLHTVFQNKIERGAIKKGYFISTVSWSLFGIQGIIGGFFATCWKGDANVSWTTVFSPNVLQNFGEQNEIYITLISMAFGLVFGTLAGIVIYFTTIQGRKEYFDDGFYWRNYDGIYSYRRRT